MDIALAAFTSFAAGPVRKLKAMREFAGYLLIGCLAVMATGAVALAGLGYAVGARPADERIAIIQHVDRSNKGDRLDLRLGTQRVPKTTIGIQTPAKSEPIPIGCDPAFSPLNKGDANFPARCTS
jgi:hypothetical protein